MIQPGQTVAQALGQSTDLLSEFLAAQAYPPSHVETVARLEAEQFLCSAAGWSRLSLLTELSSVLSDENTSRLNDFIEARLRGEPLQYLLGEAPFLGRLFGVRPGCLIPRPETEILVQKVSEWVNGFAPSARVLDLGTGSGCIAVSVALACPNAKVTAVDLSMDAIRIAQENVNRFAADVTLLHEDGLECLRRLSTEAVSPGRPVPRLNVLVSNPPYIPSADISSLAVEVRKHEPTMALDGGEDGLDFYREICRIGSSFLESGSAACFFEVGEGQAADVVDLFSQSQDWAGWQFSIEADLRGIGRIVAGQRDAQM